MDIILMWLGVVFWFLSLSRTKKIKNVWKY